ncbi:MAG: hypothetical protein K2X27_18195 [Candidatus Obscuribacterales bacterium]|nr:hypothetical protein [Candidatus Obscuribacterales bacterium]
MSIKLYRVLSLLSARLDESNAKFYPAESKLMTLVTLVGDLCRINPALKST